jgi:hypothetical protein
MEMTSISRSYLESLSTTDLVALADEFGLDIPEGLNRRFIIGELLEIATESAHDSDSGALAETEFTAPPDALPESYNETKITVLVRDPGWVFVCWDFQMNLFTAITENHQFESFFLRVNSLSSAKPAKVTDFFDVDVGTHDRKWYIHLSRTDEICRVDLYSRNTQEKEQLLARSSELLLPVAPAPVPADGKTRRVPPLVELSGLTDLRKYHARNHRQLFS